MDAVVFGILTHASGWPVDIGTFVAPRARVLDAIQAGLLTVVPNRDRSLVASAAGRAALAGKDYSQ